MAARQMGELLLGEGEVAIISFMPGSAATMEREEGFREELQEDVSGNQGCADGVWDGGSGEGSGGDGEYHGGASGFARACSRITSRVPPGRCWRSRLAGMRRSGWSRLTVMTSLWLMFRIGISMRW